MWPRILVPNLVAQHEAFTGLIAQSGTTLSLAGDPLPVSPDGTVQFPAFQEQSGNYFLKLQLDSETLVEHVEILSLPEAVETRCAEAEEKVSSRAPFRVRGTGLNRLTDVSLVSADGNSYPLGPSVGSSLERIYIVPALPPGRYTFQGTARDGKVISAANATEAEPPKYVDARLGKPTAVFDPKSRATRVSTRIALFDRSGKPLPNTIARCCTVHPSGCAFGRLTTNAEGATDFVVALPGELPAESFSPHVYDVPGYGWNPGKTPPSEGIPVDSHAPWHHCQGHRLAVVIGSERDPSIRAALTWINTLTNVQHKIFFPIPPTSSRISRRSRSPVTSDGLKKTRRSNSSWSKSAPTVAIGMKFWSCLMEASNTSSTLCSRTSRDCSAIARCAKWSSGSAAPRTISFRSIR